MKNQAKKLFGFTWIPGATGYLACSDEGVLHRYRTMSGEFEPILLGATYQRVNIREASFPYAYLVARALLAAPPVQSLAQLPSVTFADGNRLNSHPSNLSWYIPRSRREAAALKKAATRLARVTQIAEDISTKLVETHYFGDFRQLVAAPNAFVKHDGTFWRLIGAKLRQRGGAYSPVSGVVVSLRPHVKQNQQLKEIVADLFLSPRPTLMHRAYCIDGDRRNTHPDNLAWRFETNCRPYKHVWLHTRPKPPKVKTSIALKEEELAEWTARRAVQMSCDELKGEGARWLQNNHDLWAHPSGQVIRIDLTTGARAELPIKEGRFYVPGCFFDARGVRVRTTRGLNVFEFLCDAFAGNAHFPNLVGRQRHAHQTAYPRDGDWTNTNPLNIRLSPTTTRQQRRLFSFN